MAQPPWFLFVLTELPGPLRPLLMFPNALREHNGDGKQRPGRWAAGSLALTLVHRLALAFTSASVSPLVSHSKLLSLGARECRTDLSPRKETRTP